ncbi:MAG TPA: hypothetical protein VJR23_07660 [Candidatus Acidoferrales bacterium]|nr:hypothetical protein [Candidatus Acidoferrales bacterium]
MLAAKKFHVTLLQIGEKVPLEPPEVLGLGARGSELGLKETADGFAGAGLAQPQVNEFLDFNQRETEGLHLTDEVKAIDLVACINTKPTGSARSSGQEPALFVEANAVYGHGDSSRELANAQVAVAWSGRKLRHKDIVHSGVRSRVKGK